jgi:hypothetical protein
MVNGDDMRGEKGDILLVMTTRTPRRKTEMTAHFCFLGILSLATCVMGRQMTRLG